MAAQAVEYSTFTFEVTEGVDVDGATIGTIGGSTIIGTHLERVRSKGNVHTYHLVIAHDTSSTTALEYSVRDITITDGSAFDADNSFRTVEGASKASALLPVGSSDGKTKYDLIVVHLTA